MDVRAAIALATTAGCLVCPPYTYDRPLPEGDWEKGPLPIEQCVELCLGADTGFAQADLLGCKVTGRRDDRYLECEEQSVCRGRRPPGLASRGGTGRSLGAYFAAMAHDEAASVIAFERLARELREHGAPGPLVRAARRSADQERDHARAAGRLARRFGAEPRRPRIAPVGRRTLEALAVENVREGCAGETFGAALAGVAAKTASSRRVREVMARIAEDETEHAELAWEVHAWVRFRVDPAPLAAAHRVAIRPRTCAPVVHRVAGVPDPAVQRRMRDVLLTASAAR